MESNTSAPLYTTAFVVRNNKGDVISIKPNLTLSPMNHVQATNFSNAHNPYKQYKINQTTFIEPYKLSDIELKAIQYNKKHNIFNVDDALETLKDNVFLSTI